MHFYINFLGPISLRYFSLHERYWNTLFTQIVLDDVHIKESM